ncbi:SigB/SigF/SigG family RNA polymerase sigma factor [Anaerotignum sp.]|nr:SigB/SigF/SigG family RNA polymerase sigma factor [Anaerotignum sp.]MBQ7757606.1 SigB/SigF/SigG family RNA polymerase sigma factor [Anaerotignum sp.]
MEHTYACIRRAQAGDAAAKDQLLQENSGLIWSVVRRFQGRSEAEDLYQIGAIGLLKCIEKFDFSYDVKFSTYAVPMIMGEIKRFLRDDGTVKVSRSLKELSYRAKKLQEKALQEENRELTLQEMAALLEVEKEELLLALESGREVESLYASQGGNGNNAPLQLIDKLADTTENDKMLERLSLMEALEHLDAKERQIITMRYFQDRTQSDVAKYIGISQVQVSRIEKRVLSRMQESLK